jgi:hypothetical protein
MAFPAPPPPSSRRIPEGLVVAVVIAVPVILVLSIIFLGVLGGGGGPSGAAVSFSSARHVAGQAVPNDGTWNLSDAVGLDLANSTTEPLNLTSVPANCTVSSLSGPLPTSVTFPSFQGNLSSGLARVWELGYLQPSTHSELVVIVTGGAVGLALELSGPNCLVGDAGASVGVISTNVIDSPTAASAVAAVGGLAFLHAHSSGVYLQMLLFPSDGQLGAVSDEWDFAYSTCPSLSVSGAEPTGASFNAEVNATTGLVVPGSVSNGTCGGSFSQTNTIGSALHPGFPTLTVGPGTGGTLASQGCTSGDYCYPVPIDSVSENVTPGDFDMKVTSAVNESGVPVVGYSITTASGQVVVYETGSVEDEWTDGTGNSSTLLTAGMVITVDVGTANPSGTSLFLTLTGTGAFSNSAEGLSL